MQVLHVQQEWGIYLRLQHWTSAPILEDLPGQSNLQEERRHTHSQVEVNLSG